MAFNVRNIIVSKKNTGAVFDWEKKHSLLIVLLTNVLLTSHFHVSVKLESVVKSGRFVC